MLHHAPPWSGYLEAGAAGDISTAALPSARPLRRRRPYQPDLLLLLRLSLARAAAAAPALARSLARPAATAALPLARAAALLRLSHTPVD